MENKHTPDPWIVKEIKTLLDEPYYYIDAPLRKTAYGFGGAVMPNGLTTLEADARLMAAAPDMLDALQSLLGYFERPSDWCDVDPVDIIKTAISKATGKGVK